MNNTGSIACLIQLKQAAGEIPAHHQGRQLGGLLSVGGRGSGDLSWVIPLNPHGNSFKWELLPLFYRWEN